MNNWFLKFNAWIYRQTGWYTPYAKLCEYRMLEEKWDEIDKMYQAEDNDISLEAIIGLTIGMWQCQYGFCHRFRMKDFIDEK